LLFEESGCALFLVLGCRAGAEVGGFEQQALALARIQSFVCRFERDRRVRGDPRQYLPGARHQIGRGRDLVDETDAIGFLSADHLAGED
jgi:hypothetical protein